MSIILLYLRILYFLYFSKINNIGNGYDENCIIVMDIQFTKISNTYYYQYTGYVQRIHIYNDNLTLLNIITSMVKCQILTIHFVGIKYISLQYCGFKIFVYVYLKCHLFCITLMIYQACIFFLLHSRQSSYYFTYYIVYTYRYLIYYT